MKNRSGKKIFPVLLSLIPVFIMGCATSPEKSKQPTSRSITSRADIKKDSFSDFPERYRLKAREDERKGDLPKALKGWEVVKSFFPTDAEAGETVMVVRTGGVLLHEGNLKDAICVLQLNVPLDFRYSLV